MSLITRHYGTAFFNEHKHTGHEDALEILNHLVEQNELYIDTARLYGNGKSEEFIGSFKDRKKLIITTKIKGKFMGESLTAQNVHKSISESLESLKVDNVDLVHLHCPDQDMLQNNQQLLDVLNAMNHLIQTNKIKRWGLSNFTREDTILICETCLKHDLHLPKAYQGQYNMFARKPETEIIPTLRKYKMEFHAWSPYAGGFLLSTEDPLRIQDQYKGGIKEQYQDYYDRENSRMVKSKLLKLAETKNMKIADLVNSWLNFHSALNSKLGDVIVWGSDYIDQVKENLHGLKNAKPLDDAIINAINEILGELTYQPSYFYTDESW